MRVSDIVINFLEDKNISKAYYIYDEFGDLMRKVRYKAEAHYLIRNREGWHYKFVPRKKVSIVDLVAFG